MRIPSFDLDDEVSVAAGKNSTKEVIEALGRTQFKRLQYECFHKIVTNSTTNYVIASGGEVIRPEYDTESILKIRQLIKEYTYNICLIPSKDLDEDIEVFYPRLNDGKRYNSNVKEEEFRTYIEVALPQYFDIADVIIFTHDAKIDDIFNLITNKVLLID